MSRCIAYRAVPGCPHTWFRCRGKALRGWDFCRNHANAIYGIMLGLSVPESPEQEPTSARQSARPAQSASRKQLIN